MTTVNSLSGGQTSSYIAANYPADYNVFALVRTSDINCLYPDAKVRQIVSDKIGTEFIGTLEDDTIINTILDLEQYIGKKIDWVTGKTFDDVVLTKNGKTYLPNVFQRFCTSEMKLVPLYNWWKNNFSEPVEMRIGYRANENRRALNAIMKQSANGLTTFKDIIGHSKNGRNKWGEVEWQKQTYPLIADGIYKDNIIEFWKDKPVRFAYMNNCIGCFHRNEVLLNLMSKMYPEKFNWFIKQEQNSYTDKPQTFKNGITYERIREYQFQQEFAFDDFTECDSGYCGL
jgi:hypothetical protein